jgi:hypothetical protein
MKPEFEHLSSSYWEKSKERQASITLMKSLGCVYTYPLVLRRITPFIFRLKYISNGCIHQWYSFETNNFIPFYNKQSILKHWYQLTNSWWYPFDYYQIIDILSRYEIAIMFQYRGYFFVINNSRRLTYVRYCHHWELFKSISVCFSLNYW